MTKVAAIILNWKQPKLTTDTVDSLLKTIKTNIKLKVFIVDNGSEDGSIYTFTKKYSKNKNVITLDTKTNLGYVGGNNFGIKYAQKENFDYYLISNNDVIFDSNFLVQLLSQSIKYSFYITSPKIYFYPGKEYHYDRYTEVQRGKVIWSYGGNIDWKNVNASNRGIDIYDKGQFNQVIQPDFVSGCCMLVKSDVFKKIGYFDEKYFMYLEDADFSRRALKFGYTIGIVPTSIIWHINAGSSTPGGKLHDYFLTRNRLIFGFRYANLRTKIALFKQSLVTLALSPYIWQKKGVFDFYFNNLGKGSWK